MEQEEIYRKIIDLMKDLEKKNKIFAEEGNSYLIFKASHDTYQEIAKIMTSDQELTDYVFDNYGDEEGRRFSYDMFLITSAALLFKEII